MLRRTRDPGPVERQGKSWSVTLLRALNEDGTVLWPDVMSLDQMRQLYWSGGSAYFRAVHLLDPSGLAGLIFKPEWMIEYAEPDYTEQQPSATQPGRWVTLTAEELLREGMVQAILPDRRLMTSLQACDLAISQRETADYFARWNVLVSAQGDEYVHDVFRGRLTDLEMMADIARAGRQHRCRAIGIESHAFQSLLLQQARRDYPNLPLVELDPAGRDKVMRARPFADHFERGKVYFKRGARWQQMVRFELEAFPGGAHDDLVDAGSFCHEMSLRYARSGAGRLAKTQEELRKGSRNELGSLG